MRLLIVNSGLRFGGAEKQIIELSRELISRGHTVAIYTLTGDVPRLAEIEGVGIEIVVDDKRGKLDLGVLWRLHRFIRSYAPDLVHGFLHDGNLYSRVAAIGLGIPVLNSERNDNYSLRPSQLWPHRLTKQLAAGVVANTWAGRDFAQRLFGLPDRRMHVVWNGIRLQDVDVRIRNSCENYRDMLFGGADVRVACLVGTLLPAKDYLLALDVADGLTRADDRWRVLFIGDSLRTLSYDSAATNASRSYRAQVFDRYEALDLHDRAIFVGQRPDALEMMAQCDVLFSTSKHEGFPNVVLEAMSVGLPAIAVEYSDIRRILPAPWQVTERTADAMVQAILNAADRHDEVAARQVEWVRCNATIERATDALEAVYRQYLGTAR